MVILGDFGPTVYKTLTHKMVILGKTVIFGKPGLVHSWSKPPQKYPLLGTFGTLASKKAKLCRFLGLFDVFGPTVYKTPIFGVLGGFGGIRSAVK